MTDLRRLGPVAIAALSIALAATSARAAPVALADAATGAAAVGLAADVTSARSATSAILAGSQLALADGVCAGRVVGPVQFDGCAGTPCDPPSVRQQLASLVDLQHGRPLRSGDLAIAWQRLDKLGFFKRISAHCQPDGLAGARVRFDLAGHEFVRAIEISGNAALFQDELRAKLLIQAGDALDVDLPRGKEKLLAQKEAFEALYRKNGFDDARIELYTTPMGPGLVRLHIAIREGDRQRVSDARFDLRPPPPRSAFEEQHGLACPPIGERALRNAADVAGLEVFSTREGNRIRNRIRTWLRRLGYGQAGIEVHHEKTDQSIRVVVTPGRCAVVRILVRDDTEGTGRGNYLIQDDRDLYDALPFGDSGLYDFGEAERGRHDLLGALENRGYVFADVRLDWRPLRSGEMGQVSTAISYFVATGYVSQIRGIFFHAIDRPRGGAIADDVLRGEIATRAYDFFDAGGFLQIDQLLADLDKLRQFFVDQGYYQFRYAVTLPAGVTPTAANRRAVSSVGNVLHMSYRFADKGFRVRKPLDEHFIYLDIDYVEGDQTTLRALDVAGARQIGAAAVREVWNIAPGDTASHARIDAALGAVENHYRNNGFFRATVKLTCATADPPRGPGECSPERLIARTVDVRIEIDEGERVAFGEAFVLGAFATDLDVIVRDLPPAGTPYAASVSFDAQRRLRNLGLFSQVGLRHIGDDERPPRSRLATVVQVVEDQHRYFEALAGFQTINADRAAYEEETLLAFKETIDHATTATDRIAAGFGRSQNLVLPNLLGTIEGAYVDRNFWRSGKLLRLAVKLGATAPPDYGGYCYVGDTGCSAVQLAAGVRARYSDSHRTPPWWSDTLRYASLTATYEDARLFGSDVSLRASPYLTHDYAVLGFDYDRVGVQVSLSRRFFGRLATGLTFDGGLIRTRDRQDRGEDFSHADDGRLGLQTQFTLTPSLTWDDTDSPLDPRRGALVTFSLPYINAFVRDAATDQVRQVNYFKWEGMARVFRPLGDDLVLALMAHAGTVYAGEDSGAQIDRLVLFRLGGQFTQTLLRGFADYGVRQYDAAGRIKIKGEDGSVRVLGPADHYRSGDTTIDRGSVVANGSIELRFPLLRKRYLFGAVHWDFGAIADAWGALYRNSFRHGIGLSAVWMLQGQIPLRAGIALGIDDRCIDVVQSASGALLCEKEKGFATNAGMLYAF